MNYDEEELQLRARIREILNEQIKGGKARRFRKKRGGQHYTQGTHWGTGKPRKTYKGYTQGTNWGIAGSYTGGTSGWIKFVKKVQKEYGITYKKALKKASSLRKKGKMDPYFKRKFKRRGPGRPKKKKGGTIVGGDLVHMIIDALEKMGVPVDDLVWDKVITPVIKLFLPPSIKKLIYGGGRGMSMSVKKKTALKIAKMIKKFMGRGKSRITQYKKKRKPYRKRPSSWVTFVKKVHKMNPHLSYKDAMSYASSLKKKGGYMQSGIGEVYGRGQCQRMIHESELIGNGYY